MEKQGPRFDELGAAFVKNREIAVIGSDFDQGFSWYKAHLREHFAFLGTPVSFYEYKPYGDAPPPRNLWDKVLRRPDTSALRKLIAEHGLDKPGKTVLVHYPDRSLMRRITRLAKSLGKGFTRDVNLFASQDFLEKWLSVFAAYVADKVYFWHGNLILTTVCNLNCKFCLNFTPFIKHPQHRPVEELKREMDVFFGAVDKCGYFQISGGEPMLYKPAGELIQYIYDNYSGKLGQLLFATNGTLMASDELCEILHRTDTFVICDNYTRAAPKTAATRALMIEKFQKMGVRYADIDAEQEFFKLFPPAAKLTLSDDEMAKRVSACHDGLIMYKELKNGRLYFCNYSSFAATAGLTAEAPDDYYDLHGFDRAKAKELVEFRLGYSNTGYDSFCRYCNGHKGINKLGRRPAGEQASGRFDWNVENPMLLAEFERRTK
ncbi:hypothetical protein FACS1894186_0660 [Alphaproteobacteria bacterium]|nr:hypothetical protein FACS1894186_0660 [Alphaproteobacteria bacterium]